MIILGNYKNDYDIATKTAQWALTPKQLNLVEQHVLQQHITQTTGQVVLGKLLFSELPSSLYKPR